MGRLQKTVSFLLLALVTDAEILDFDERNSNDLCYVCTCNADVSNVDCSRRGLIDLPDGAGDMVKNLNISYNEISIFPKNLRRFYNLVSLDVSGNRLSELPGNALENLTALEILNLSRNNFETWLNINPNEVLQSAISLKILDLSHNKFRTMGNLANHELLISPTLETLILDYCQISSVHGRSPVSGLINIRVLKLNNNPLIRVQNLISPSLKSLYLSNCEITTLNHYELTLMPSLIYLKMSHNYRLELSTSASDIFSESLRYLDISFCNLMHPSLHGFPNLRRAILNHNMVRYLKSDEFVNNTKLEHLDLSYNNIGSIKTDTFHGLSMLKYLDLSWNEIAEIPENCLLEMPSLSQLILSRNYLTRVGHLKSMSVTTLDMSSCEISTIGKDSLEGLQSLVDLNLSHNLLPYIPDSLSSNTVRYLNFNYNRISYVGNFTFFMLPRLTGLAVIGNRFTTTWNRSYFQSNPYLERLDLSDNMWRCDCSDPNMFDFYEFVTLEPSKKEESFNLICNSPTGVIGQTWLEACYFTWNPSETASSSDTVIWFIIVMVIGLGLCLILVNLIRRSMKRRLAAIQAERERQVEEARDRLRQLRIRAEQEALINTPDPRDLIAPPSYDEALSMPKLNVSCHSLCEPGTGKSRKKRAKRKTKSSGDLLEETERNGDVRVLDDLELNETPDDNYRPRRAKRVTRFGSHEIADLDGSPGARRRRMSEYDVESSTIGDSITVEVEAQLERSNNRRHSNENNEPRESDF